MIVVDTSVWIDYFNGFNSKEADILDSLLGNKQIGVLDIILLEVLQGFKTDAAYSKALKLLSTMSIMDCLGRDLAIKAATNFRFLKKKGVTVRSAVDIAIATFCIENKVNLLHKDRDFLPLKRYLGLRVVR